MVLETIPRTTFYICCSAFSNIAAIFELLLVIFFSFHQIIKRDSAYNSVYYVLLNVGYTISVWCTFAWLFYDLFGRFSYAFQYIAFSSDWYFLFFLAFWNFIVGLYRCTALGFSLKHERIWSGMQIYAIIIVILFPFAIFGHSFSNSYCIINIYDNSDECKEFSGNFYTWLLYVNVPLSFLTVIAIILSVIKIRCLTPGKSPTGKVERRLILQTILTVCFQLIYYILMTENIITIKINNMDLVLNLAIISLVFVHYSNILVLFIVCHNLRREFLIFYGLKFLVKRPDISKTTVIVMKSSTRIT